MTWQLRLTLILGLIAFTQLIFFSPPVAFPVGTTVHVAPGTTVSGAAKLLADKEIIRYESLFKTAVRLVGPSGVQAGTYAFPEKASALSVAYRMVVGDTGLSPLRVTIHEGMTVVGMASLLEETLGDFDDARFIELGKQKEGYLFPDTYNFLPGSSPEVVIDRMLARYEEQVGPLREPIAASGRSEHEIITMASLLEREARRHETMKTVAGILWKRIEIGMPLQVDAVFGYIFDRPTFSPSLDDLEIDSPYNTYRNRGLPPGPIASPGLDAIRAAIEPTESPYLYYLTGADGFMYYAKTFEEHVANRRFLR